MMIINPVVCIFQIFKYTNNIFQLSTPMSVFHHKKSASLRFIPWVNHRKQPTKVTWLYCCDKREEAFILLNLVSSCSSFSYSAHTFFFYSCFTLTALIALLWIKVAILSSKPCVKGCIKIIKIIICSFAGLKMSLKKSLVSSYLLFTKTLRG